MTIALVSTLALLGILGYNEMRYREITWREFCNNYLSKSIVSSKLSIFLMRDMFVNLRNLFSNSSGRKIRSCQQKVGPGYFDARQYS